MAISRDHGKKSPTQNPIDFYQSKQQGGRYGTPTSVPDVLNSPKCREKMGPGVAGNMDVKPKGY